MSTDRSLCLLMVLLKILLLVSPIFVSTLIPITQKHISPNAVKTLLKIRQKQKQQPYFTRQKTHPSILGATINNDADENIFSLPITAKESLRIMMRRMIHYFESMVDPHTNEFFLMSYPQKVSTDANYRLHQQCSLREMGCAWDATTAVQWLSRESSYPDNKENNAITKETLGDAILQTVKKYTRSLIALNDNGVALHFDAIKEQPNIAHNGLLLLTLMRAEQVIPLIKSKTFELNKITTQQNEIANDLTRGILSMQRKDGAFKIYFSTDDNENNDVYAGIDFFSGEAMTALLEVYFLQTKYKSSSYLINISDEIMRKILPAMKLALQFYRDYYDKGRRDGTLDVNYTIWQIQAFSRLYFILIQEEREQQQGNDNKVIADSAQYCLEMSNDIISSPSWKMLSRGKSFYPNLSTIEIACGLDALVQGTRVSYYNLKTENGQELYNEFRLFVRNIENAIDFLQWSQDQLSLENEIGYGGLGFGGVYVTEQRLDVTGHALSGIAKLLNYIEDDMV